MSVLIVVFVLMQSCFLIIAVALLYAGWVNQRRVRRMLATPRTACADIAALVASSRAGGAREVRCEVSGEGRAGPSGLLRAPFSDTPCLWYRVRITHQERDRTVPSSETTRYRTVTDFEDSSGLPFLLVDDSGAVVVQPGTVSYPEVTVDKKHPGPAPAVPLPPGVRLEDRTYTYGESVVREGVPLYVLGAADVGSDGPVIGKPESGKYEISCRSEEETIRRTRKLSRGLYGIGALILAVDAIWATLTVILA